MRQRSRGRLGLCKTGREPDLETLYDIEGDWVTAGQKEPDTQQEREAGSVKDREGDRVTARQKVWEGEGCK